MKKHHHPHPPHPKKSSSEESSCCESSSCESSSCESSSCESSSCESSSCHDCHDCHKCHCKDDKDCGCLCRFLEKFSGSDVIITTKTGNTIIGKLEDVTKDCCVKIIEPEVRSPFIPKRLTVISCKSIESFSVELLGS